MKKTNLLWMLAVIVFLTIGVSCNEDDFSGEIQFGEFTDSRDGHKYKTVKIGDQIWMAENLAYLPALPPPLVESSSSIMIYTNKIIISEFDPYYYVIDYRGESVSEAKATDNYKTYGVLYNWPAATNACPSADGWHLPTDEEWKQLEIFIGMSKNKANDTKYRGTQGKKLKAVSGWQEDGNGTDEYGFSALPGGQLAPFNDHTGGFSNFPKSNGRWWSATESDNSRVWMRDLSNQSYVYRFDFHKHFGLSVRCIKD